MEVKYLIDEKDQVKIEIVGEGHTLCNPLVKELWNDDKVEITGYDIDHSLISNPILIIRGNNPKNILKKAISNLNKNIKELDDKFKKLK